MHVSFSPLFLPPPPQAGGLNLWVWSIMRFHPASVAPLGGGSGSGLSPKHLQALLIKQYFNLGIKWAILQTEILLRLPDITPNLKPSLGPERCAFLRSQLMDPHALSPDNCWDSQDPKVGQAGLFVQPSQPVLTSHYTSRHKTWFHLYAAENVASLTRASFCSSEKLADIAVTFWRHTHVSILLWDGAKVHSDLGQRSI